MTSPPAFAKLLEGFFVQRLMKQREASPNTVSSYRDTFRLLLRFCEKRLQKKASQLELIDIDATLISGFLDELESARKNAASSRNARLAAIRSFFKYAALESPAESAHIQRVLAIPSKRQDRRLVGFLTHEEIKALLAAPDLNTWTGRRDHALLLVALQTGLRVSELVGLEQSDVVFGASSYIRVTGKGRKERCTPLTKQTAKLLRKWLQEAENIIVFPTVHGNRLSSDAVQFLLAKHVTIASRTCKSLKGKRVTPHMMRHYPEYRIMPSGRCSVAW